LTKSINLKNSDLPSGYKSHLSEMKGKDRSWHFDPSLKDKSAIKLKDIIICKELQDFLLEYCETIPVEIGTSAREGDLKNYKTNTLIGNKLDHVFHGYTEHNSQMSYERLSRENSNPLLKDVIDQTKLKNASIGLIKVSPGHVIPWHYDSYVFYKKTNNVEEENNVERHIVFPFPWHWGHIYQIGNNVISNWKKGESYTWPVFRYHLAVNAGVKDFYLLAITGLRNDS